MDEPIYNEYLQSVSNLEPADTAPFFYTRLRARMEKQYERNWLLPVKPVWVVGALVALLLLNGWILQQPNGEPQTPVGNSLQEFAQSYDQFNVPSY